MARDLLSEPVRTVRGGRREQLGRVAQYKGHRKAATQRLLVAPLILLQCHT